MVPSIHCMPCWRTGQEHNVSQVTTDLSVPVHYTVHCPFSSSAPGPSPLCQCNHFSSRPRSWPADPVLGVCWCRSLMSLTSSITMSPLPPPSLLSIVRVTVSSLVSKDGGVGVARSLCKWWKRARDACLKRGPCLAKSAGWRAERKAPFLPWQ